MGAVNFLSNPTSLLNFTFGFVLLILAYLLFVALMGKKALFISGDKFYRGIAIAGRVLLKERVDVSKYAEFYVVKKRKSDLPWFSEYSGQGIFANYHECSVHLTRLEAKKGKRLISMSEFEMYDEVRRFLKRWTDLKEQDSNETSP